MRTVLVMAWKAKTTAPFRRYPWLVLLLGIASMLHFPAQGGPPRPPRFLHDRVIVAPKEGIDPAAFEQWMRSANLTTTQRHDWLGGLRVLTIGDGRSVDDTLARAQASGLVEWVEPDYILTAFQRPNDAEFIAGSLWNLENVGAASGVPDADIDATEAWDRITDASSIIVAVVDSGILTTHEDLAANLWTNPSETAGNGVDDDGNGIIDDLHGINAITGSGDPTDDVGHGTHVAGILGAVGNNGRGITGIAWKVQIMALKFLNAEGEGSTSTAIQCMDYARSHGARIINASWGGGSRSRSLELAIQRARAAGIVFVVAAGNEGSNNDATPSYPASYTTDNMVVVAATTRADALASYSNFGASTVDLAAPGSDIRSAWFTSSRGYADASGTSMAAPHVAGALALLAARYPGATYLQLIDAILQSADPLASLTGRVVSGGRLNVDRALATLGSFFTTPVSLVLQRGVTADAFTLQITGSASTLYTIEGTSDFDNWTAITTVATDASGTGSVSLTSASAATQFFRVRQ
ncbi:MAG: S8 family serine peptidase [Verrucomicrobiales bacterium]|nr:S8 family serine peptidase [Verrucomicrobiales bacterium]